MTPEQLAVILLAIVGVALQLIFKFVPKASDWYQSVENKGLVMLGLTVIVGLVYLGLACSPFAAQFDVTLTCDNSAPFTLLKSLYIIASAQQLTYLYTRSIPPKGI
jgi:hypothetical protein